MPAPAPVRAAPVKGPARDSDNEAVRRFRAALVGLAALVAVATPAVAQTLGAAPNNPGYRWATGAVKDLVTRHGWPSGDTANLGRAATRRELARALAELMSARGQTPPASPVLPSDIAPSDPDGAAISWVSTIRLLGNPGAAFDPNGLVSTRAAEVAIVRIFGLGTEVHALDTLHTANGTRLSVPTGFGQEVLAAELGLRFNYPSRYDNLEVGPAAPMPLANLAGMVEAAVNLSPWRLDSMAAFTSIVLPNMTSHQRTVVEAALAEVGMPYVWGGTSPNPQTLFGARVAGGFDCSGLVWWSYKLSGASAALGLGRDLRGRTADAMAWERASERVPLSRVRVGDLVFFGPAGPHSPRGSISHVAISLGNGWIVQSTGSRGGVSVTHLTGYWDSALAWARRPASVRGGATVAVVKTTSTTGSKPPAKPSSTTPAATSPGLVPGQSGSGTSPAPAP
jgi:cell wall-associated NlpC family hydrolase